MSETEALKPNLDTAIRHLFPSAVAGRDYTLQDDGEGAYIKLWSPSLGTPPTSDQLLAAWDAAQIEAARTAYRARRAEAYAREIPFGDQLDAILKAFLAAGVPEGSDLASVVAKWLDIKDRFPKP